MTMKKLDFKYNVHNVSASCLIFTLWSTSNKNYLNALGPRQNGRHFTDDISKCIFLNENVWILNTITAKFVSNGWINNIPVMVQIMAWRRPADKPLSEPMIVRLAAIHICVTWPQWVNSGIIKHWSREMFILFKVNNLSDSEFGS